ncbi:MAG: NPCBM/NEW2 domain-containing protein [Planctomycetota bacterium]|jgi:hypothetical protein
MRWTCISLLTVAAAASLPGQESPKAQPPTQAPTQAKDEFLLSRVDGKQWKVKLTGVRGRDNALELSVQHLGRNRWVGVKDVLALHGPAPKVQTDVAVYLVAGGELKGRLSGGRALDELDETFLVATSALGTVPVQVDRLRCVVFRSNAPLAGPAAFQLPKGTKEKEAVFKRARRGFDTILGEVERFTADGILFQPTRAEAPLLFRYSELAAFALRGGVGPEGAGAEGTGPHTVGQVQLITTAGDLLRVRMLRVAAGKLWISTEGVELQVPLARIAALSFRGGKLLDGKVPAGTGRVYLSELPVLREEERASADDLGTRPLFRYRRDRTASGGFVGSRRHPADGFLTVDGRTYGKGLGVHSRSKLIFRVPEGHTRFHALVGIDDEVLALGVRGNADVRVLMRDKVLFTAKGLQRGQPPRNLGILKVEPGALLTLEVDFGQGMFLGDRVDWLSPVFLR